jgi:hypothetical protein
MKRRGFLQSVGIGAAAIVTPAYTQIPRSIARDKKPNIIYIMIDELDEDKRFKGHKFK